MAASVDEMNLASIALGLVGEEPLQSLEDNSKAALVVKKVYAQARNEIFDLPVNWKFASTRAQISPMTDAPLFGGYAYQFALPTLYRRLISFVDATSKDVEYPYRREIYISGSTQIPVILTNYTPCYMKYLALLTNVGLWPGWFSKMVYLNIAIKICKPLTREIRQKVELRDSLADAYEKAKAANGMEGVETDDKGVNLDLGNSDVLDAAGIVTVSRYKELT